MYDDILLKCPNASLNVNLYIIVYTVIYQCKLYFCIWLYYMSTIHNIGLNGILQSFIEHSIYYIVLLYQRTEIDI
jgi:hypothetical protein